MFKKTPCFGCTRPERLPNCLCQKDCTIHATYQAEKAEYNKKRDIERGLNSHASIVMWKNQKIVNNHRRFGGQE